MTSSLTISQTERGLRGAARVPADKSITHRGLILGAVATGESRLANPSPAGDCAATLACIQALGAQVDGGPGEWRIRGVGLRGLQEPADALDCCRSGTTMRLLAGLLAGQEGLFILRGDPQLHRRPMGRIVEPLRAMGAQATGRAGGKFPPLVIQGAALRGTTHHLAVASAQVKSCLLLAGLLAEGTTTVHSPAPSRDHTERLLQAAGVPLREDGTTVAVEGPVEALAPLDLVVPGDFSSAAFLLVAACLVPGSEVVLQGVGLNPTRMGLLHVLRQMGASVEVHQGGASNAGEPVGDLLVRWSPLRGVEVGGEAIPALIDEVPILAVAATQAEGTTVVRDAADLRHKESDRIAATVQELRRLGARIEERPDGFVVEGPARLRGARVESHGDHRLALALAVAGLVAEGETVVEGFDRAADSFPGFPEVLADLLEGGR